MLAEFWGFLEKIIASTWNMLNSSSPWIIFSFLVAGLLHEFLKPEKIQKTAIGSGKISGVFWTRDCYDLSDYRIRGTDDYRYDNQ